MAAIRTPDQRLRVFVSSTLGELAAEREAARVAIERLRLTPVMFELGARPHPPRELYRSYLEQSDVFVGIYGESYGWVAPEMDVSGLEDEYLLSQGKPSLIYVKRPAPGRQERLSALIERIEADGRVSYKSFASPEELGEQISDDLAVLLTERFAATAAELPSGTVTMLFTDIEGSTKLVRVLGGRFAEVLDEHRAIIREAIAAHDGHEIGAEGDSFFVVFRRASDALAAAVDAQRALGRHRWPEGAEIRVRMGLHTGEPALAQEHYVGLGVHRAARIAAAGHGGQILVSETTHGLVEGAEQEGVVLRDLGLQRLKDFEQPQRLFEVVGQELRGDFPPPRTLAAQEETGLAFAGKEAELAQAAHDAIEHEIRRRTRRHLAIGSLVAVAAAGCAVVAVLALTGGGGAVKVGGDVVALLDPRSNKVVAAVPVGTRPAGVTFGSGSVWVANLDDRTVSRLDPSSGQLQRTIPVAESPDGIAAGFGAVWVASNNGSVSRIDPAYDDVRTVVRGGRSFVIGLTLPSPIAIGPEAVYFANTAVYRLDPRTGRATSASSAAGYNPASVSVGDGAIWIADNVLDTVTKLSFDGSSISIPVGHGPSGLAVGAGGVWVADSLDDAVERIDPDTAATVATIPVGADPAGIAVGAGSVWVANSRSGTVSRIDPATNRVADTIRTGNDPTGITVAAGRVWVTVQRSASGSLAIRGSGGVAHVALGSDASLSNTDPALANSAEAWQLSYATCAKLVDYPDEPAPAGEQLVPEVAAAMPRVSDGGRVYTFTIRPGYRFSPPSNQPVTAQTFKDTIERTLAPSLPAQERVSFMNDIVGARTFQAGNAAHISGVTAAGDTLTIQLTSPSGSLPARLATPYFCAVPSSTPVNAQGTPGIPSAGPYYIAFYAPGQRLVLARNPNYHGSRPHHLAAIDYTIGTSPAENVRDVESGRTDYAANSFISPGVPNAALPQLERLYGRAQTGRPQFYEHPNTIVNALFFNAKRPLFHSARLRRAAAYALDRTALTNDLAGQVGAAQPLDQYLPPYYPGFPGRPIYPPRPDLAIARKLAGGTHRVAIMYDFPGSSSTEAILSKDLGAIGIQILVKHFAINDLLTRERHPGEPYDLFLGGYGGRYQDPADTFDPSIAESGVIAANRFASPLVDRELAAAERLPRSARIRAYSRLDIELARELVPAATYAVEVVPDFLAARIGCVTYQPVFGIDLAALCLRH